MMRFITLLAALALFTASSSFAQLSGTRNIPCDYVTLADAVTALNTQGVGTGGVTFNVAAGHTETLTGKITITATGTAANPVVFQKNGAGANPRLTSYTGTAATPSVIADGFIVLAGSDYITFDGIDLAEAAANTTTTTVMEFGFGIFLASATNGSQNNTIKNCTITLNRIQNTAWTAPGHNGSVGIAVSNGLYTATGAVTITAPSGSNSFNKFYSNTIQNCNAGIALVGFAATTGVGPNPSPASFLGDLNNDVGGSATATGNTILNFGGGAATNPAHGVFAASQWNFNVSYNTINSNNGSGANHATTLRGIFLNSSSASANATVNNNSISVKSGATTSQLSGIDVQFGSTPASNTITISNNNIQNCTYSTATTGTFQGITTTSTATNIMVNGNTVSGNTVTGSGQFDGIIITSTPANVTANGNRILNNSRTTTSTTSNTFNGMYTSSTATNVTMNNNRVANNTINVNTNATTTVYCIRNSTSIFTTDRDTMNNNQIIYSGTATSTGTIYGYYNLSSPTGETITNCEIYDLSVSGTSTSSSHVVGGIYTSTTASSVKNWYGNSIYNLSHSGSGSGTIYGIRTSSGTTINLYKNKIYSLSADGASGAAFGIYFTSGVTGNIYNNLVSGLTTPATNTTNSYAGIYVAGGTTANITYNTIYPSSDGALTSTGASFGGSGIYVSSSVATTIKNNIINITGTAASGYFAAIKRSAGTAGVNPTNLTLSNNIYHSAYIYGEGATEASATNLYRYNSTASLGTDDPNFNTACGLFKTWKGDVGSFSEDNLGGTAGVFQPAGSSFAESGATTATTPAITDDYNSAPRDATTPDMGAIEFSGTLSDASGPAIGYTPIPAQNCNNQPSLSATITDASNVNSNAGTKPRLYYKKHTEANALAGNTSAGNGWKYVEAGNAVSPFTFTIDYSLLTAAPVTGDSIQYFIVAEDLAGTPNVGTNTATYPAGFCPTTVALTAPAFPVTGFRNYVINVSPTVVVKASPLSVCANNNDTLTVDIVLPGNITTGSGTVTSSTYTPYYGSTTAARRIQYLVTAAELTALGLRAGNITAISFDIATVPAVFTIADFTLKMGHTALGALTTNFSADATTTVVPAGNYAPVVGNNTHTLSTPFAWDGVSNVLIEACHGIAGTASLTTVRYTSGLPTGISCYSTNALGCTQATGTTTTIRPNITLAGQRELNSSFTNFAWNDGSGPVGNNNDTIIVQPAFPSGNSMTYTVTVTDASGCSFNGNVVITRNTTAPVIASQAVNPASPCFGDSVTLSVPVTGGCPPYSYAYTFTPTAGSPTPITLSPSNKYFPTVSGTFNVTVTDNAAQVANATVGSITMLAQPTTTGNVTRCGPGPVSFTATGTGNSFYWYNAPNGGTLLHRGATYAPTVTGNANFYVDAVNVAAAGVVTGRTTATAPGTAITLSNYGQLFTITKPIILNSVDVFSTTGTALTVSLYNAGGTVQLQTTGSVTTATNAQVTIPLGWSIAPGTYRLAIPTMTGSYYRENSGPVYPIAVGTSGNIEGFFTSLTGANTTTASYYFMYNWNIDELCGSSRTMVTATVTAPPALATVADATACNNESKALNVTSSLANYDGYTWSPVAGLFTDAAGTTPYTGQNLSTVYVKTATGGTTNYVVTGTNSTTQCASTDTVSITVMPASTISASPPTICVSGTTTLTVAPTTGYGTGTLQWQQSATGGAGTYTDIGGQTGTSYTTPTINSNTWYGLQLKDGAGNTCVLNPTVEIVVNNPTVTGSTPGSSCGPDSVALSATGSAGTTLNWYTAATGGSPIFTGPNFKTPVINSTTNYYVAAGAGFSSSPVGPATATTLGAASSSTIVIGTQYMLFDALTNTTITAVDIYPTAAVGSNFSIIIRNSAGTDVYNSGTLTTTVTGGTTPQTVLLNAAIPAGTGYRLGMGINPGLQRNTTGASYPYTVPGALSFTGNSFDPVYWYFFYNVRVQTGCEGPRTMVTATINPLSGNLAATAGGAQVCQTANVSTGKTYYNNTGCDLIARVVPAGAVPVAGSINTCVKIDGAVQTFNGEPYVQRHYDIEPATNAANATATVTLYFRDQEFVDFNTARGIYPALPTVAGGGNTDPNIANLRVTQYHGTGTAPGNYTGPAELIDPVDASIVWNATSNWWEVSFPVTGFSGFYIHTGANPIPVKIEYFRGSKQGSSNLLNWKLVPVNTNTGKMELQHSTDSRNFATVYSLTATATQMQQPFSYADARTLSGVNYYRLKVTDDNGVVNYSAIVALINSGKSLQLVSVAPNPVTGDLARLNITAAQAGKMELVISDAQGRMVQRETISLAAGFTSYAIQVGKLAAGVYQVYGISADGKTQALRLVKQ
jgi:trimeric autotransporter adhesin